MTNLLDHAFDVDEKVTARKRDILVDALGILLNVSPLPANLQHCEGAQGLL